MPAEQIEAMLSADVAAEIPFTIQITKLAERPRHSLKYNDTFLVLEDKVQLPRLFYTWHSVKGFSKDDAALDILAQIIAGDPYKRAACALAVDRPDDDAVRQDGVLHNSSLYRNCCSNLLVSRRPERLAQNACAALFRHDQRFSEAAVMDEPTNRLVE